MNEMEKKGKKIKKETNEEERKKIKRYKWRIKEWRR